MNILVVLPARNEELIIRDNVLRLYEYMQGAFPNDDWKIVVSDNNSSDRTAEIVKELAEKHARIEYLLVTVVGKGAAVKNAWEKYSSDVYMFMDSDLATDIHGIPMLVEPLRLETSDIACGSRFLRESAVERSLIRRVTSFGYRLVVKLLLSIKVRDLPCGFKAINEKAKKALLSKIESDGWFFDSELIILGEKLGLRVQEIPVRWREPIETGRKSKVKIISLSIEYVKEVVKIRKRLQKMKAEL